MYEIEKNIPLPPGTPSKYPLAKMEVGDSIFIDGGPVRNVSNAVLFYRRKMGFKFVVRSIDGGVRVWRIE